MFNGTIYVITNIINDKKYVGLTTKTAEQRFEKHINNALAGMNTILYKSIRKHGRENFKVEVIETGIDNVEELKMKETEYIKKFKTYAFTGGHGYNMTIGGEGTSGYKWTEDQCRKQSEARTGKNHSEETKRKMSESRSGEKHPMYGRKHSEESKRKMSEAQSGEKHYMWGKKASEETRKKIGESSKGRVFSEESKRKMGEAKRKAIILIFPDGSKKEFSSITEASLWLGGTQGNYSTKTGIQKLLKGWTAKQGRWVGYSAMYKEDIKQEIA